jgi:signal peptidase I
VPNWLKNLLKFVAWVAGFALVVGGVLRLFFVEVAVVGHNGMAPTLFAGDEVFVWRGSTPDMGDVVICAHPQRAGHLVLGRVIALEGMSIRAVRGQLDVGGTRPARDDRGQVNFHDSTSGRQLQMSWGIDEFGNTEHMFFEQRGSELRLREVRVAPGKIFLLGDNRSYIGQDSRYFGGVDPTTCRGSVFMRWTATADAPEGPPHGMLDIIK